MNCAIYQRVSTVDQSLEVQEKRALDYARFKQLTIDPGLIFSDPDTSGRTPIMDRTGGRALMNRLKLGDVKHLVIAKLDRLGRNVRDALATLETLQQYKVTLHITDLGGESITTQGHMGKFILTIFLGVAELEVDEIRDRTTKRMRLQFDNMQLTGNVPFGYDCVYTFAGDDPPLTSPKALSAAELAGRRVTSKHLVDNIPEQNIIRLMHTMRKNGWKLEHLAHHLNCQGFRTKQGKLWQIGTVDSVLNSRHTARLLQTSALPKAA